MVQQGFLGWKVLTHRAYGRDLPSINGSFHSTLEILGEDPDKFTGTGRPFLQDASCQLAVSPTLVGFQERNQVLLFLCIDLQWLVHLDTRNLKVLREGALLEGLGRIPDPCDAAAHSCSEVVSNTSEDKHAATCHVLAAVVASPFNHGPNATVAHCEAFRSDAVDKGHPGGRTIERGVANDDVLGRIKASSHCLPWGIDDQRTSTQALAKVILRITFKLQQDTLHCEGTEGLARSSHEFQMACAGRQAGSPSLENLMRQQCSACAIGIDNVRALHVASFAVAEGHLALLHQSSVNHPLKHHEVLLTVELSVLHFAHLPGVWQLMRWSQDGLQLEGTSTQGWVLPQDFGMSNQLIHVAEAHLGHQHTHLLSHQHEVIHHMLREALEFLAQHRILRGNAHGAGVEVTLPHHDASHGNQWRRGEAKPFSP
mmetsp:Transcript_40368/g.87399  ORF Transcript_40368/g.87399 Transcript_40368/m.87399 type:complete len:427 (+) Transcript_40368:321-1601(+)